MQAMFFTGTESCHCGIYKMKGQKGKDYVAAAQDRIRDVGRPTGFQGDCHPTYHGHSWVGFLRDMLCTWWNTEPYNQHKQRGERYWRTIQAMGSRTMDRTGAPKSWWFLALALAVLIWNISAINIAGTWTTPHSMVGLGIPDISPYLCFELYQEVY